MFDGSFDYLLQDHENTAGKATYIAGDLHHLPFRASSFDSIAMVRVFHYLQDPKNFLLELLRILYGGGKLVFSYRNKMYIMDLLNWLINPSSDPPFSLEPSGEGTTLISHHPTYVKRLILQTGFTDFRYQGMGIFDRLAYIIKPYGKYAPTGKRLALFFGRIKIVPWLFCQSQFQKVMLNLTREKVLMIY